MPSFYPLRRRALLGLCNVFSCSLLALSCWSLPRALSLGSLERPGVDLLARYNLTSHLEVLQQSPLRLMVISEADSSLLQPALEHLYAIRPEQGENILWVTAPPPFYWSDHRTLALWLAALGVLAGLPSFAVGLGKLRSFLSSRVRAPRFRKGGLSPLPRAERTRRPPGNGLDLVRAVLSCYPKTVVDEILAAMSQHEAALIRSGNREDLGISRDEAITYFKGELAHEAGDFGSDAQRWARLLSREASRRSRRRIFSCSICEEVFIDSESLNRHFLTHDPIVQPAQLPERKKLARGPALLWAVAALTGFLSVQLPSISFQPLPGSRQFQSQLDGWLEGQAWTVALERWGEQRILVSVTPELCPVVLERAARLGIESKALYFLDPPSPVDRSPFWLLLAAPLMLLILPARKRSVRAEPEVSQAPVQPQPVRRPPEQPLSDLAKADALTLEVGRNLVSLVDPQQGAQLSERMVSIRRQLALELGLVVPGLRFRDDLTLKPGAFVVKVREVVVAQGEVQMGNYLAVGPEEKLKNLRGTKTVDPTYGMPGVWIGPELRGDAERLGCMIFDPLFVVATLLTEVVRSHAADLLTFQSAHELLNQPEHRPALQQLEARGVSQTQLWQVLRQLLEERVSIRDLTAICDGLLLSADRRSSLEQLVEVARKAIAGTLVSPYLNAEGVLNCILVPAQIEDALLNGHEESSIRAQLQDLSARMLERGLQPVFLTHSQCRSGLRRLLGGRPCDVVLSLDEVPTRVRINSVLP